MTNYFNSDIQFSNLYNKVLQELHEPVSTGSEAVPVDLAKDTLNAVYAEAFNDQRIKPSAREADISLQIANDTTLASNSLANAATLTLSDTSTMLPAGKILMGSDIIAYTANDGVSILSGVTGDEIPHYAGEPVRQLYPLATLASSIDSEQIQYININGIAQTPMALDRTITALSFFPNTYSVYGGHLIFSPQTTVGGNTSQRQCLIIYTQKVSPLSNDADKPSLIPNSWRIPILAYGACMKIAAADAFRTSWDFWKSESEKALSQFIAFKNNRIRDMANRRRPSTYGSVSMFR
jgi:hypothetical protein